MAADQVDHRQRTLRDRGQRLADFDVFEIADGGAAPLFGGINLVDPRYVVGRIGVPRNVGIFALFLRPLALGIDERMFARRQRRPRGVDIERSVAIADRAASRNTLLLNLNVRGYIILIGRIAWETRQEEGR